LQNIFWVSFGAVLGVNIRYLIYKKLEKINLRKDYIILLINTSASFFLGLILSMIKYVFSFNLSDQLGLFFLTGFLGSFSTFSTFVYDLYELFIKYKFFKALKLFIFSLAFGIFALAFGMLLGNK
tara:strand:+ start:176 stop:550 length:375 start_codon:yes stop_codon:yes gene_type:complete